MDAGERAFLSKGVSATTIEEITGGAGTAKGTFYLYFTSKDDLLAALRERFVAQCRERIAAMESRCPPGEWAQRLDACVEGGVRVYLENVPLHDILFHCGERPPEPVEQGKLLKWMAELIRQGSDAQAWKAVDPEIAAVFLFQAIHGVIDYALAGGPIDEEELLRSIQSLARNAVGCRESVAG
jgi:AcrR family transcriptional regulator